MARWVHKYNVAFESLSQRSSWLNECLLVVKVENEDNVLPYEIKIESRDFKKQIQELKNGQRDRCYFAWGMQDIDFYKRKDGRFAITHSPYEGLNVQLIFADGEFDKMLDCVGKLA